MNEHDLEGLQAELNKFMEAENRRPRAEMDYLSPNDMSILLYEPFSSDSPIQLTDTPEKAALITQIPFFALMQAFLRRIQAAGTIKLTKIGNLPRQLCLDLYGLGLIPEDMIEKGITKLSKETDSISLQNLKIIAQLAGLTKKRTGKLSLTAKGEKILEQPTELFQVIFQTYWQQFNWGYHDGYAEEGQLQTTFGFIFYLLLRYGEEERHTRFFSEKHALAFPMIYEAVSMDCTYGTPEDYYDHLIKVRVYDRFLDFFGWTHNRSELRKPYFRDHFVQTTEAFRALWKLDKSKFQFDSPAGMA